MMLAIAAEALAGAATIHGTTATSGAPIITDEPALAAAAAEIARIASTLDPTALAGILIAAFGDPGLAAARAHLSVPVTGLAEAALAATAGHRFSIVTTTPGLDAALRARVAASAHAAHCAGIRYTASGLAAMHDPDRLHDELRAACDRSVADDGVSAIIIGGGPLASAARRLRHQIAATLIEPIPAAIALMLQRAQPP